MSLADELRDPWGLIVAGVSGGMVWALLGASALALPVGIGVGAAVLGVKAVSGALLHRGQARPAACAPRRGSAAEHWLSRAERAVRVLDELTVTGAASEAHDVLDAVERLGAQTVTVEKALARVDAVGLDDEAAHLAAAAARPAPAGVRAEIERSAAAVRDRVAVRNRLRATHDTVLARMQSAALGLEGVAARMAEVEALAGTTGASDGTASQVAALTAEVEGLRSGLAEAEALSRRVLDGPPEGAA